MKNTIKTATVLTAPMITPKIKSFMIIASALLLFQFGVQIKAAAQVPGTLGWHSIPNTTIRSVCAGDEAAYLTLRRVEGCDAITNDWNSGIVDRQNMRLILWGAGHDGYWGNELYALNLGPTANSVPTIKRLDNPALPSSTCTNVNSGTSNGKDGTPVGRHTNDQIVYVEHLHTLYNKGGVYNCTVGSLSGGAFSLDLSSVPTSCDAPNNACASAWTVKTSAPSGTSLSWCLAYDSQTRKVWAYNDNNVTLYEYTPDTDTFTLKTSAGNYGSCYQRTSIVDPKRRLLITIGAGAVKVWDLNRATPTLTTPTTTGATAMVSVLGPGLAYDENTQTIVAWQSGNTIYRLNPDTWAWTSETYSGGPTTATTNGTYKRFAYVPSPHNMFVVCNDVDENCFALRTSLTETAQYDFTQRCRAFGVIRCFGFDTQNDLSPNSCTQAGCWSNQPYGWFAGQATISLDTNIKASGASAFRLDIGAGQNGNAAFFANFANDYSQLFGANQTFYVSFRQYFGTGYKESVNDSSNAKQAIISTGSTGTGVANSATSCTNLEVLFESFYGVLGHYNHCPPTNNWQEPFSGTTKLQNARTTPFCLHSQTPPGGGAGDGSDMFAPNGNCWAYVEGAWMSFKLRLDIGTGPTGGFWQGSRGRTWAAYDGQAWEAITDWQFGISTAVQHEAGGASEPAGGTNSKYGQVWLTARNDTAWPNAPVFTLYDELIISMQDIAAPGISGVTAPSDPTNLIVRQGG